jgi:Uma2 family endonuclease
MNIALLRTMTVPEFLAWAEAQGEPPRAELINGCIVPTSPERAAHNRAKMAVMMALHRAIADAGLPCEVMTDGMTVRIDDHTAYEPDALVYCGEKLPAQAMIVERPMIVVEILSPATAHTDTSAKLIGYFKVASVRHYLVLDPEHRTITHNTRNQAPTVLSAGRLQLDPPGIELAIADVLGPASPPR